MNWFVYVFCSPFLFVSRGQEAMLDDLIKMLEGEEVNEVCDEITFNASNEMMPFYLTCI